MDNNFSANKKLSSDIEELFKTVYEQAPIGICLCNSYGEIYDANPAFESITGWSKEQLIQLGWLKITHPDDVDIDKEVFEKFKNGEHQSYSTKKRYLKPDGSSIWAKITAFHVSIYYDLGSLNICMIEDITEKVLAEHALAQSLEFQKEAIANISDVISVIDNQGNLKFISPNVKEIFGWDPGELMSTSAWSRIHPEDEKRCQIELNLLKRTENMIKTIEFRYMCKDGSFKHVELAGRNLLANENIQGILLNFHDISERINREEKINYLNFHDSFTGLFNRAYFEILIKNFNDNCKLPLSVIVLDINGLAQINRELGQEKGDQLVLAVADKLKACCREKDIISRTGGDEFVVILQETPYNVANDIAKFLKGSFAEFNTDKWNNSTISLGIATRMDLSEDIVNIIYDAEKAMYLDKLLQDRSLRSNVFTSMKTTLFEKSKETRDHADRVIAMSKALGNEIGLSEEQLDKLELLAYLHDIGKIGISDAILNKPGRLSEEEWVIMRKHTEIGYRIAMSSIDLQLIAENILYHHERFDGMGYPAGLVGENIPILDRIITIVDSYDAMTHDRVYRNAMTKAEAMEEIMQNAGKQFDPNLAKIFVEKVLINFKE